jgi:hypothetical protein
MQFLEQRLVLAPVRAFQYSFQFFDALNCAGKARLDLAPSPRHVQRLTVRLNPRVGVPPTEHGL